MKRHTYAMAAWLLVTACFSAQAEVVVVVNPKNAAAVKSDDVAAIYKGSSSAFPGGGAAVPAALPEGNATRDQFMGKVLGKTDAQYKAILARVTFSGKGTPPREFGSDAEVKKFVAANPDAIGYIDKASVDGSVKVVVQAP